MTLHHDVRGDGPAVLLVHAGVADSRMWPGVAGQLAATHRVVTCDLRGFGKSPLPPERFSHAADLVALLDELGIERAAVVGASFGGYVALELALRAPGRVMALALLDPFLDEFDPSGEFAAFAEAEEAALEAGDVEAVINDEPTALAEIAGREGLEVAETINTGESYGIAVDPANEELLQAVNDILAELIEDGTYEEIYSHYPDLPPGGNVAKS
jgi:pimeloyl-ACP methyl ester carboxylesterase